MKRPRWFPWVEAQMVRLQMSRRALAEAARCDPSYLTYLEKTKKVPSAGMTARIGKALGLQDDCLLLAGFAPIGDSKWEHLQEKLSDCDGEQEARLLHEFRKLGPDKRSVVLDLLLSFMERPRCCVKTCSLPSIPALSTPPSHCLTNTPSPSPGCSFVPCDRNNSPSVLILGAGASHGGRQPSLESLLVVAGVLGCTVDELIVKDVVVPDDSS